MIAAAQDREGTHPQQHLEKLRCLTRENRDNVVGIGEIGLDYERTEFCGRDLQADTIPADTKLDDGGKLPNARSFNLPRLLEQEHNEHLPTRAEHP